MPLQKVSKQQKLNAAKRKHEEYIAKLRRSHIEVKLTHKPDLKDGLDKKGVFPTSDRIPAGVSSKRSIMEVVLRGNETEATKKEIAHKAKRVAPAFNKGGIQYITDGMDPKSLGRKI